LNTSWQASTNEEHNQLRGENSQYIIKLLRRTRKKLYPLVEANIEGPKTLKKKFGKGEQTN
jgi:hypothetical protein